MYRVSTKKVHFTPPDRRAKRNFFCGHPVEVPNPNFRGTYPPEYHFFKIKIDDTLFKGRVKKKGKKVLEFSIKGGKASFKKMKSICGRKLEGGGHQGVKKNFFAFLDDSDHV